MLLELLQTSHTTWGHRYSNVLNFSWNVCYIQDSNVKFFGGRAGGGKGVLGVSWCCGSHCQCGFYSPSFQSFVLSHLVIGPVRMIPTYLSPKSTLTLTSHLGQNVSIGEGWEGSFAERYNDHNVCLKSLYGLIVSWLSICLLL